MAFHRSAFLAAGLVALAACNSAPAAEEAEPQLLPPPAEATAEMDFESKLAVGKLLAETHCSGCHAIGPEGDSPHEEAKPFRKLSQNYPVSDLFLQPADLVSRLSQFMTLQPGDIVSCGTGPGALPMRPGATIDVSIDGIGTLSNTYDT